MNYRIVRRPEVRLLTGLSDSSLDRLEQRGEFPPRRRLGPNAVGWLASEVETWIADRPPAHHTTANPSEHR